MTRGSPNDRASRDGRTGDRRQFIGVGAGVGVTLLAGCTGGSDSGTNSDVDTTGEGSTAGTFRLPVSGQPVAIDDFGSLDVSFDRTRVFGGEAGENGEATNESETEEANETETNETDGTNETQLAQDGFGDHRCHERLDERRDDENNRQAE